MWVTHYLLLGFFDGPAAPEPEPEAGAPPAQVYGGGHQQTAWDDAPADTGSQDRALAIVLNMVAQIIATGVLDEVT